MKCESCGNEERELERCYNCGVNMCGGDNCWGFDSKGIMIESSGISEGRCPNCVSEDLVVGEIDAENKALN